MTALKAALRLYLDALGDTVRALPRSGLAIVALFGAHVLLTVAGQYVGRLGLVGAFLLGFLHAGAVGWYLSLVEIGVSGRRRVLLSDLRDNVGVYLWEVISVLFIFWIAGMLLQPLGPVYGVAVLVATLLFNPVPEQIYQDRSRSVGLLGESLTFMQKNWPEWLGAHLIAALVLAGWAFAVGGGGVQLGLAISLLQVFGPWFGFVDAGGLAMAYASGGGAMGAVWGLLLLIFVHAFMLYRGVLYRELSRSSRRGRAWQARMR